jgi:hypothetical protein
MESSGPHPQLLLRSFVRGEGAGHAYHPPLRKGRGRRVCVLFSPPYEEPVLSLTKEGVGGGFFIYSLTPAFRQACIARAKRGDAGAVPDFIPATDGEFAAWVANFVAYVCDHQAELPLSPADLAEAADALSAWDAARAEQTAAIAAARAATQSLSDRRVRLKQVVRRLAWTLRTSPQVTGSQTAGMGLKPRDTTLTPAALPPSVPIGRVEAGQRLLHRLHFADRSTPTRRRKPAGVRGCEVWVKVGGEAPAGAQGLAYVDTASRSPLVVEFGGEDAGKMAHYMLRWVSTRGERGAWGETVSATIAG